MLIDSSFYATIREDRVQGRYVTLDQVSPVLLSRSTVFGLLTAGSSVQGKPIYQISMGTGRKRVLMWSQMHGNESTTTKAVLDLLAFLQADGDFQRFILDNCTICILPVLNPDGAKLYTRTNANDIDLNRDAQNLTQPESVILREVFNRFGPHFCFNLHDQRTLFNVGATPKPATVSFLAPARDRERSVSGNRAASMRLIAAMNNSLQKLIPGQVGRYDDTFNINCVGDTFQAAGVPTILFEAGHYQGDYRRERTREFIFRSLVTALDTIAREQLANYEVSDYLKIPENNKRFLDIIIKNPHVLHPQWEEGISIGIQYKELIKAGIFHLQPVLHEVGLLRDKFGHAEFDCMQDNDLRGIKKNMELFHLLN